MKSKKQVKILLLEDNPGDARLIVESISEADESGFSINHVTSMKDALKEAASHYDIILSDLSLPDSSGLDTYRTIRSQRPEVPIVILSGNLDEELAITAVREGAQDYLVKGQPDGQSLVRCIKYGIERKKSESELEHLRTQQQHSAKMASLGEMAGGMAHEINTPLGSILLTSQALKASIEALEIEQKDSMLGMVDLIEQTTNRISKIVKSLKTFSRGSNNTPFMDTKLSDIIDGAVSLCAEKFSHMGIDMKLDMESFADIKIQCRESEIAQVLLNLLTNARDALEPLEKKWVKIFNKDLGEQIELTIQDSGSGIPENVVEKIFNPFFTSKDIGKGTGLGLSISKGIIESHGGKLRIDKTTEHTTFVLCLPKIQKQAAEQILKEAG